MTKIRVFEGTAQGEEWARSRFQMTRQGVRNLDVIPERSAGRRLPEPPKRRSHIWIVPLGKCSREAVAMLRVLTSDHA